MKRVKSCLLLVVVLERESCRSIRVQIRSHVVPLASESDNSVLNFSSSSLTDSERCVSTEAGEEALSSRTHLFCAMAFSFFALYSL